MIKFLPEEGLLFIANVGKLMLLAEDADARTISDLRKIVKNGTSEAYDLADGTLKAPCSSCAWVLKFLRMKGKK